MELNVEVEVSSDALDEGFDVIVKMVEWFVDGDGGTFVVVSVETENGSELHSFSVGPYNNKESRKLKINIQGLSQTGINLWLTNITS